MATRAAHLPPGSDAVALLAREAERSHLAEALRQQRLRLADLADGVDEARLVEEMNAFDPDAAAASLTELERRDEDLGQQEKDRYAERDRLQRKRGEFESGIGAEAALQQRRNAEAELVEAARRWAVLKAASALLGGALEHHRAARRDPLMTRAGEAFATLTGGAFAGLDQSFYDDDEAKLEACRANGERAPVAHLSEGARDQLYLALRLAYIEDYAARAEAPPFIGDDIFASFDELPHRQRSRSACGDRRPHSADRVHAPSARHRRGACPSRGCRGHHSNRLSSRRGGAAPVRRHGTRRPGHLLHPPSALGRARQGRAPGGEGARIGGVTPRPFRQSCAALERFERSNDSDGGRERVRSASPERGRIYLAPLRLSRGTLLRNLSYGRSAPRQRSGPCPKTSEKTDGRRM